MYRELGITEVKEVLRRWQAGQSNRQSAKAARVDRNTIGRYVRAARGLGIDTATELTDEAARRVAECVRSRATREPSAEWNEVAQHHDRIAQWLGARDGGRPLKLTDVRTELARNHGLRASYDTLWRYAREVLGWRPRSRPLAGGTSDRDPLPIRSVRPA